MFLRLLKIFCIILLFSENDALQGNGTYGRKFPKEFIFGASTAAYQIEGGWNEDGRGPSIWDVAVHQHPSPIKDGGTGDVAADSYHQYQRDVEMAAELGLDFYRFSISWSRILPSGFTNEVNQAGVDYYNNLINELLQKNVRPFVTMYHWDLPANLQKLGGWANPKIVNYFADYANVLFDNFGDRVKHWITFNEPKPICYEGYGADWKAPFLNMSGIAEYLCAKHLLVSHAMVYRMYNTSYREVQNGTVGITLSCTWIEPKNPNDPEDREAAVTAMEFGWGQYAEPIFGKHGDFPSVLRRNVQIKSSLYGFPRTRLPVLTKTEIDFIKGTADFFGLNAYTTRLASKSDPLTSKYPKPSYMDDMGVVLETDPSWPQSQSSWLQEVPWGLTKLLKEIKDRYDNPELYITENGWANSGADRDDDRIRFIRRYLNATLDALDYGCKVKGYFVWSLMDNFEWNSGYSEKFGLYRVVMEEEGRPRIPRLSAFVYKDIINKHAIDFNFSPNISLGI